MGSALLPGQVFISDLPGSVDSVLPQRQVSFVSPCAGPRFDRASFDSGAALELCGGGSVPRFVRGLVSDVYESATKKGVYGRCVFHAGGIVRLSL